jgi:hypothetical protein
MKKMMLLPTQGDACVAPEIAAVPLVPHLVMNIPQDEM